MRKIVVGEFVSLDMVMQAPGGANEDTEGDFTRGGWTWPFWHDEIGAYIGESFPNFDTLLLGRKTWQIHAGAFAPHPEQDPFGDIAKYVVSTTLESADGWRNSTLINQNVIESVRSLKDQPGKSIYIDGSSVLVHALAAHDLIDEYHLLVYPLVLGQGKRLFAEGQPLSLRLTESRSFPTGIVLMKYARA